MKNNVMYLANTPQKLQKIGVLHEDYVKHIEKLTGFQTSVMMSSLPTGLNIPSESLEKLRIVHMDFKSNIATWVSKLFSLICIAPLTIEDAVGNIVDLSKTSDKYLDLLIDCYSENGKKYLANNISLMVIEATTAATAVKQVLDRISRTTDIDLKDSSDHFNKILNGITALVNCDNKQIADFQNEVNYLSNLINDLSSKIAKESVALAGLLIVIQATSFLAFVAAAAVISAAGVSAAIALDANKLNEAKMNVDKKKNEMTPITQDVAQLSDVKNKFMKVVTETDALKVTLEEISKSWIEIQEELLLLQKDIESSTTEVSANKWNEVKKSMDKVREACTEVKKAYEVLKIPNLLVSKGALEIGMTEEKVATVAANSQTIEFLDFIRGYDILSNRSI